MPQYKALKSILVTRKHPGGQITTTVYNAGDLLEYDGKPGESLEATCAEGRRRKADWLEERGQIRAKADMEANTQTRAMVAAMFELFGNMKGEPAKRVAAIKAL